jgi:hypothetical protein
VSESNGQHAEAESMVSVKMGLAWLGTVQVGPTRAGNICAGFGPSRMVSPGLPVAWGPDEETALRRLWDAARPLVGRRTAAMPRPTADEVNRRLLWKGGA